ncbi:MAG: metalloregulator ArsR/SmtB family transcription factor [Desulfovibrionaceae bacterium]|nr:metalloregulator ArsR/SmtB family transcription factor [Desulfovibrionaceae bacterium]
MDNKQAAKLFEALSSDVRLAVFRLLVRDAPEGRVQGDIAAELGIPSTNLSFHLKALVHSGLVSVEREGRFMRYKAAIPLMLEVIGFLTAQCCSGNPRLCQCYRDASPAGRILPRRVGQGD